jgi:hypothetical protein
LISDPARAARLEDAAKKLKANKGAIVQLTARAEKKDLVWSERETRAYIESAQVGHC